MRRVEEEEAVLRWRYRLTLGGLLALLLAAVLLSFGVGYYPLSPGQVAAAFLSGLGLAEVPPQASAVFWSFRLPRILSAALIGASLSVAGAAYQGMFRNPLVSPDILGVSSGASLGAAAAILGGGGGGSRLLPHQPPVRPSPDPEPGAGGGHDDGPVQRRSYPD